MKMRWMYLVLAASLLSACAQKTPSMADKMMSYSDHAKSLADNWKKGDQLIASGNAMQSKGVKLIAKGKSQIYDGEKLASKGKDNVSDGNDLVAEGKSTIAEGQRLKSQSELSFNQNLVGQPENEGTVVASQESSSPQSFPVNESMEG